MSAPDMLMSPGDRIKLFRQRRGLTQEAAAQLMGRSVSCWRKWEAGERSVSSLADWIEIARILAVNDMFTLTGLPVGHLPDDPAEDPHAPSIRAALLGPVPALESPPDPANLARLVDTVWGLWQTSIEEISRVGTLLPELILMTRTTQKAVTAATDKRVAATAALKLWHLLRSWCRHTGVHEMLLLAADRGAAASDDAGSLAAAAMGAWNTAMALSTRGWAEESAQAAESGIAGLRPHLGDATSDELAIYGALELIRGIEYSRIRDEYRTSTAMADAMRVAGKTGDGNVWWTVFGPTNAQIYAATIALEQSRPAEAIRIAERIDLDVLPSRERQWSALLVMGQAHTQLRQDVAASTLLARAEAIRPEGSKVSPWFRGTVQELLRRETPATRVELRPLAAKLGLN